MNNQEEIWKDVPNYDGLYQVSSLGNVKSLSRHAKHPKGGISLLKERFLKPSINNKYLLVGLCKNGKRKVFRVHQLVAMSFLNHVPNGHEIVVDHINNNKLDNRLENLQIITNRENVSKDKKGCTSKYTGVSWCKKHKKWVCFIRYKGKKINLGSYICELDASKSYIDKLKEIKNEMQTLQTKI